MEEQKNWEDFFMKYNDFHITEEHEKIARMIHERLPEAKDILDIGCGSGEYAVCFSKFFSHVIALDISNKVIANLEDKIEKTANMTMIAMDYADYETPHDISFLSFCPAIQYLDDLKKVMRLSKKGVFLLTVDTGSMDFHRAALLSLYPPKEKSGFIKPADWFRSSFKALDIHYEEFLFHREWEESMEKIRAISYFMTYFQSFGYKGENIKKRITAYVNENSVDGLLTEHHILNKVLFYVKNRTQKSL